MDYYDEVEEAINNIIGEIVSEDISSGGYIYSCLVNAFKKSLRSQMYGLYSPKKYRRRYGRGGLADPDNIRIYISNTDEGGVDIEIVDEAPYPPSKSYPPDTPLDEFMTEGMGRPGIPRPFYEEMNNVWESTYESIVQNHLVSIIINEYLEELKSIGGA